MVPPVGSNLRTGEMTRQGLSSFRPVQTKSSSTRQHGLTRTTSTLPEGLRNELVTATVSLAAHVVLGSLPVPSRTVDLYFAPLVTKANCQQLYHQPGTNWSHKGRSLTMSQRAEPHQVPNYKLQEEPQNFGELERLSSSYVPSGRLLSASISADTPPPVAIILVALLSALVPAAAPTPIAVTLPVI